MNYIEILGYMASGAVFATFCMKSLIPLRIVAIVGNLLFFGYGINADLANIVLLHGALLPLNGLRLYQAYALRRRMHEMARSDYDIKSLIPLMTRQEFLKNDILFQRGDDAHDIYYLMEGKARIIELDLDVAPGHLLGEIAMFTPDKKRTQTVRCSENCSFLSITDDKVLQLFSENPEFGLYLIKMIVDRLMANADTRSPITAF